MKVLYKFHNFHWFLVRHLGLPPSPTKDGTYADGAVFLKCILLFPVAILIANVLVYGSLFVVERFSFQKILDLCAKQGFTILDVMSVNILSVVGVCTSFFLYTGYKGMGEKLTKFEQMYSECAAVVGRGNDTKAPADR